MSDRLEPTDVLSDAVQAKVTSWLDEHADELAAEYRRRLDEVRRRESSLDHTEYP